MNRSFIITLLLSFIFLGSPHQNKAEFTIATAISRLEIRAGKLEIFPLASTEMEGAKGTLQ